MREASRPSFEVDLKSAVEAATAEDRASDQESDSLGSLVSQNTLEREITDRKSPRPMQLAKSRVAVFKVYDRTFSRTISSPNVVSLCATLRDHNEGRSRKCATLRDCNTLLGPNRA